MIDMKLTTALEKIKTLELEIAKYKQLFESSRDALMTIAPPSWKLTSANKAALELFEISSLTELTTLGPWDLSPERQPDGRLSKEKAQEMIEVAMRNGSNSFEWENSTTNGKSFATDVLLTRLSIGGETFLEATVRDIDDKKKIEEKLRQERDFSTRLVENAPVLIVVLNKEGKIVRFNRYIENLTNYSIDEVRGKSWFDIFIPKSFKEKIKNLFFNAIEDMQTDGTVNPILTKEGMQREVEWHNKTLKDPQNNTIGLLSIGVDVTEHLEEEKQLKLFRTLLDNSKDSIEVVEPLTMRYLDVNDTACRKLGYSKEELLNMSVYDINPLLNSDFASKIYEELKQKGNINLESIQQNRDGLQIPSEVSATLIELDRPYIVSVVRDITERKRAEQTLRESEAKLQSITTSAQDGIIMIDNNGDVFYWNEAAEKIFGYSKKEAMGQEMHDLITPKRFLDAYRSGFDHFKKTGEGNVVGKTIELTALKKDTTEFPVELSLSATIIDGLWCAIGIIRDITERKKMENEIKLKEEMMLAQSKQAAMGDMISMIAHQWRQPLAVIGMNINNLKVSIDLEDEITKDDLLKHADSVSVQLKQLSDTIDNFSNFFKPNQPKEKTTIKDILKETLNIIGTSLSNNNINLNIKDTTKSSIFINKASLMQVLLNIIGNAKDMIIAKDVLDAKIDIVAHEDKNKVTISICDNAGGIPKSIINKIGSPYFTTKQSLNGTGLGLYISKTIIEKHFFGKLTWHNRDNCACFVINLPTNHKQQSKTV